MSLAGKVVLVTGASKGIGKAVVERLGKDGASVVVNYASDTAGAEAVVASIGAEHALAVQADVSTIAGIESLVSQAVKRFGRLDVVMANAGVMTMRSVMNTTEADFDKTFAINVKGPYFLVQKAVPHMPPGGRVILVSTGIAHSSTVQPGYTLYGATKGAIEQMTRIMSKDLATKGITVNAIGPGPTATDLFFEGKSEQLINMIKSQSPFNELGKPEDIAAAVKFLASDDSRWISGQTILVNGAAFV
ncbi:putative 60s ribosomal protein l40 protein [Phaeoacremonium minimum UCRPA7]|uniref:Putative 60s ribosomal protein l40 protein n=1 Tax=Phaeoacremonium minimum (strain UCR-PA7) TaxID=1286976 RepID=R8B9Q2_PHAM7|nr:putative 60s ribosomal protein l40 protein [Phaeoacremonium minimum UCRPA7]EON96035.1 putative 60s ribosomal protein l40 protein [Phaeoacremonium minimum UCRPA7]